MGLFGSKPVYSHKTDEQLWYEISENLTELSRRDEVNYRVRATRDSVKQKLISLGLFEEKTKIKEGRQPKKPPKL